MSNFMPHIKKMQRLFTHAIILLFLVLGSYHSFAQSFSAAPRQKTVKTGDRFQVEFSANAKMDDFTPPSFNGFQVLSGPNQSTSMSWVNGKTSSSITYSYILRATKEGEFSFTAKASFDGKTLETNPIQITVTKGAAVAQQSSNGNSSGQQQNQTVQSSEDIYIKASVNKTNVYQGEQLIATYKLYTRLNIVGNELIKNADLNGFWSQEIDLGQSQWSEEIIGGYRWNVATIRKIVLFPQRTGTLEIDPLSMKFVVRQRVQSRSRSMFDQFFGSVKDLDYELKSKPIKIKVKPLPQPQPASFNGAVGKLDMKLDVSKNEIKANEAVNIKIKVSGKGNINLIDRFNLNFPSDFETYDPKINNNIKTNGSGVSGSKAFNYLVIPRHAGNYELDPVVFSYFDPATKKYNTITSDPITINVLKGDGTAEENVVYTPSNKEEVKVVGKDIRYIHTQPLETAASNHFYASWKFYLLLLLAPLLFFTALIIRNKVRTEQSDTVKMKSKKAGKMANKLLASAKQSLDNNDKKQFYESISKALFGYVANKLNMSTAELNQTNIKEKLQQRAIADATVDELINTIELCDMARFAPINVSEQEIYSKASNSIQQIEQELG